MSDALLTTSDTFGKSLARVSGGGRAPYTKDVNKQKNTNDSYGDFGTAPICYVFSLP